MFKCWGDFLLDSKQSPYKKPDRQDCYHGPNSGDWLITRCHQINFGVSEDENGLAVKHNGVWFCRNNIFQPAPDKVIIRRNISDDDFKAELQKLNLTSVKQKHDKKIKLTKLKVADLHHLGCLLSRIDGDFKHWYPHPDDTDTAEVDEQEAEAELEEFISACHEYDDESDTESYVDDNTY